MNDRLRLLLDGSLSPGIYRFDSRARPATVAGQAEKQSWRAFDLDGDQIGSKSEFLRAAARAMSFPTHFGNNWDALEDSLRDLAWAPTERGYLVLYDHAGRFASAQPDEFATALDILRSAVGFWQGTPTPMVVLLRGAGRSASGVPRL
jgi:hypothetical protein